MVRPLALVTMLVLFGCSGAHFEGGGRAGGGGGGSGGASTLDDEAAPDPLADDDVEDLLAEATDDTNDPELAIVTAQPKIELLDVAFDEVVGSSSEALTSDCPENRDLRQYDGPASWPSKYGVKGLCVASRYACRMPTKDPDFRRYENPKDPNDGAWPLALGIPVVDGRGNPIGTTTVTAAKLNWGQRKSIGGKQHVYAFSVGSGASDVSGWVPASCVGWDGTTVPDSSCVSKSGTTPSDFPVFNGRKPTKAYDAIQKNVILTPDEVVKSYPWLANVDPDQLKITCNAPNAPHRSIADYIPQLSSDGTFYKVNLLANVPGISPALGGIASDTLRVAHEVSGTMTSDQITFHRLIHVHSIAVFLFKPASTAGAPTDGANVRFVYGYVTYPSGNGWRRRYGWLPSIVLRPK